jgi:hypothetical protein
VDVDQPEDAPLVRKTWGLNFGRHFVPGTLVLQQQQFGGVSGNIEA